jgi:nitrate reductase (NAD(P)H)
MMNNGWYVVKLSVDGQGQLLFRHPYHQEGNEGWMTPSVENQLAAAKQDAGIPDKQFTRQEIESHASKDDAWLVINGNVYDVTSVLAWHPGGTATILANAGKLSPEVTSAFESIHDDYAHKKLQECVIGRVSEKAETFMREQAKAEAEKEKVSGIGDHRELLLQSKKWVPVKLVARKQLSSDTFAYTFSYKDTYNANSPSKSHLKLGLGTCQHIQMGIHMLDKLLIRSYTPTRPIIGLTSTDDDDDDDDSFELTVKTYFPDENQPGGAFSNFLHELPLGQTVEANGPTGEIKYMGNGRFDIEGKTRVFHKINLILGGSGVTPGYALLQHVAHEDGHTSDDNDTQIQVRVLDANKSEQDILLREQLGDIEKRSAGRIQITHVISHTADQDQWGREGGLTGHINAHMIRDKLFPPALGRPNINTDDTKTSARGKEGERAGVVTFLCGPPSMIQKAALPALRGECCRTCYSLPFKIHLFSPTFLPSPVFCYYSLLNLQRLSPPPTLFSMHLPITTTCQSLDPSPLT